jgi:hypothetical protein
MTQKTDEEIFEEYLADLRAENALFGDAVESGLDKLEAEINGKFATYRKELTEAVKRKDMAKIEELKKLILAGL